MPVSTQEICPSTKLRTRECAAQYSLRVLSGQRPARGSPSVGGTPGGHSNLESGPCTGQRRLGGPLHGLFVSQRPNGKRQLLFAALQSVLSELCDEVLGKHQACTKVLCYISGGPITRAEAETAVCSLSSLHSRGSHAAISPAAAACKAGSKNDCRPSARQRACPASPLLLNGSSIYHNHSARRKRSAVSCLITAESSQEAPPARSFQPPPTYVTANGRIIASAAPSSGTDRPSMMCLRERHLHLP